MSQRGLEALLRPKSIAVIGASMKPNRAGYLMMRNLLAGGFNGPVLPVTPAWKAVLGVLAWPDIASLPFTPDLAVLCTNASRNLALLEELGEKGCKTCIILSAPASQHEDLRACALRHNMRLLGPNSLGLLAPWQGLNASFSPVPIKRGKLAFISQSAAVSNTILDWAQQREMGFSYFIALGDSLDIDVDELLDYLARDSKTSAILLYLEQLSDARRFVSAARSASRNKPILVIKSGRSPAAQRLLNTTAGMDPAWDAAIQRAGLVAGTGYSRAVFGGGNPQPYAPAAWRPADDYQQRCCACRAGAGCLMVTQWQAGNAKRRNLPETARCTARTCGNL